jgi:SAM-dependent methyltransferase
VLARDMTPGRVLDVGAAAGFILQGLIQSGWRGEGIEPNAQMAAYARAQLQVLVHVGSFEQFQPDTTYDLITMIQVMGHFLDPRQAFQKARALLRPGGYLLIETWNRASWTARFFGQHWHEYSPPSVLHWFTPAGLGHLAAQCAFREVARGRPQKWLDGAHAKSLLWHILQGSRLGRLGYRALQVIPDRLAIPYPAEDLFWMLFQLSSHGIVVIILGDRQEPDIHGVAPTVSLIYGTRGTRLQGVAPIRELPDLAHGPAGPRQALSACPPGRMTGPKAAAGLPLRSLFHT